mmetsp:Transcript_26350/g.44033  ORF Transcript_26350/g.44033 Transcript_26350/m.44033 type:complete len:219 (-) Transcript_26350:297-953(-)
MPCCLVGTLWYSSLYFNRLPLHLIWLSPHTPFHGSLIIELYETKTSRTLCLGIEHDNSILYVAKLLKENPEFIICHRRRQAYRISPNQDQVPAITRIQREKCQLRDLNFHMLPNKLYQYQQHYSACLCRINQPNHSCEHFCTTHYELKAAILNLTPVNHKNKQPTLCLLLTSNENLLCPDITNSSTCARCRSLRSCSLGFDLSAIYNMRLLYNGVCNR